MEKIKNVVEGKHSKYIIGGVIVVLAIYGGFMWGKESAEAPAEMSDMTMQEGEIVDMTVASTTSTTTASKPSVTTAAPKAAAPSMTKDGAYIVSYTSTGFSPRSLTIKAGKSVHFVNVSNKAMSITTVDPNDSLYRELNQSKTVGRGMSFDYTFLTRGTWVYTNRNNPTDRGVVVVQ